MKWYRKKTEKIGRERETNLEIREVILKAISEKKGYDIKDYDTTSLTPFMDHMIIASTNNTRQNYSICQNIKDRLRENGYKLDFKVEGDADSRWLLIDLKDIVVHLFVREERQVYQLDRLYADVPVETYDL